MAPAYTRPPAYTPTYAPAYTGALAPISMNPADQLILHEVHTAKDASLTLAWIVGIVVVLVLLGLVIGWLWWHKHACSVHCVHKT